VQIIEEKYVLEKPKSPRELRENIPKICLRGN